MTSISQFSPRLHGAQCACCQNRFGKGPNKPDMDNTLANFTTSVAKQTQLANVAGANAKLSNLLAAAGIEGLSPEIAVAQHQQMVAGLGSRIANLQSATQLVHTNLRPKALYAIGRQGEQVAQKLNVQA